MTAARSIGSCRTSAIGLGAMSLSVEGRPDITRAVATIHAALDAGITLIDTADAYHLGGVPEVGHNELLIARALREYPGDVDDVLVATKGGKRRPEPGPDWVKDGRPEYLIGAAKASAQRLGVEAIGLYHLHAPDPSVPFADSVGAMAELLDDGVIRMAGVSNVTAEEILLANRILGGRLASVENEYSLAQRASSAELSLCQDLGIAFLAWAPLGGGPKADIAQSHAEFVAAAQDLGVSVQQLTLAWELTQSEVLIPLPGASRPASIFDSAKAMSIALDSQTLERIRAIADG